MASLLWRKRAQSSCDGDTKTLHPKVSVAGTGHGTESDSQDHNPTSYTIIAVNDCELNSLDAGGHCSAHAYRAGDIQYFESASSAWTNSGQTEAHLALLNLR